MKFIGLDQTFTPTPPPDLRRRRKAIGCTSRASTGLRSHIQLVSNLTQPCFDHFRDQHKSVVRNRSSHRSFWDQRSPPARQRLGPSTGSSWESGRLGRRARMSPRTRPPLTEQSRRVTLQMRAHPNPLIRGRTGSMQGGRSQCGAGHPLTSCCQMARTFAPVVR